jgi:hypothetical protein
MFQDPRRYIAIQAMIEFITNAILNAAIGWYWTQGLERIPLWGWSSMAIDMVPTGFGIATCLSLIFTWRLHRRLRFGTTSPAALYPGRVPRMVHRLPLNAWIRSVLIGIAGALAALAMILVIDAADIETMKREDFIALKTIFAALVAAGAMMMAGYRALGDGITPQKPMGHWPDRHTRRS